MVFQIKTKNSEAHHLGIFLSADCLYPLLLLALLLLPPPLLLLLLVLVVGEAIFFNRSYQKEAPCETAAAVNPSPITFKTMNKAQSPTFPFSGSC